MSLVLKADNSIFAYCNVSLVDVSDKVPFSLISDMNSMHRLPSGTAAALHVVSKRPIGLRIVEVSNG
jgi:hypothetical protein